MRTAFRGLRVLASFLPAACASGSGSPGSRQQPDPAPLAGYSARAVLVLPLQQVLESEGSVTSRSDAAASFRSAFDYEIPFAFGDEPPPRWVFAPEVIESSRRNIGVSADPLRLAVEAFAEKIPQPDDPLSETLRTQIRQVVALTDARYVLLPVRVRLSGSSADGTRRATLRIVLIDARLARVLWADDIGTVAVEGLSRAAAAELAARVARLAGMR